jgi:DHA2 family multidrug resistance protein-like MFS transporter
MSEDGIPTPRRHWSVLAVALSTFLTVLDGSIVNVALPSMARALDAGPAGVIWVVNAYQIAVFVCLLPLASAAEAWGYRRVFLTGIAVFTLASLSCAMATSLETLIVARIVQGVGGACIMCLNGAITRFNYPRAILTRGIALNAMVVATGTALGPTVGSAILAVGPWPWLFAVNVPLGAVAWILAAKNMPSPEPHGEGFDVIAALLNAFAFGMIMIGADSLSHGDRASLAVLELGLGAAAGFVMVRRSLSQTRPLVPVDLMRIPIFGLSICSSVTAFCASTLAIVAMPFVLQYAMGRSEVETGFLMTPWPLAVLIAAPISGRLVERHHAGLLGALGLAVMTLGLFLLAVMPAHGGDLDIAWRMAVCGAGFGMFQSPNNRILLTSAPLERSGAAAGMLATGRLMGQTLGAALVAVLFRLFPQSQGATLPLSVACGFSAAACLLSGLRMATPKPPHGGGGPGAETADLA